MVDDRLIVITGAAGHVGGRLLKHLCTTSQHRVRPHFRSTLALPDWATNCSPTFGDLRDSSTREQVLGDADVVVHLATRGYSTSEPPTLDELNDEYATTTAMVRSAARGNRAAFDRQTREMLGEDARNLIYNLLWQMGRMVAADA